MLAELIVLKKNSLEFEFLNHMNPLCFVTKNLKFLKNFC